MPSNGAPTSEILIKAVFKKDGFAYVIDEKAVNNALQATAGQLISALATSSDLKANVVSNYTFTFTNKNEISQNGQILVTFPPEIQIISPSMT